MSKIIKQSIVILIVLLLVSIGVAVMASLQKISLVKELEKQTQALQTQSTEFGDKERKLKKDFNDATQKLTQESQALRQAMEAKVREIEAANRKYEDAKRNSDRTAEDLTREKRDRADLDSRMATLRRERDELMDKLRNRPTEEKVVEKEKIVYRDRFVDANGNEVDSKALAAAASSAPAQAPEGVRPQVANVVIQNNADETYWAGIMRQKAALEIELADVKRKLGEKDIKVEELKKANSDLEIEIGRVKNEREEIVRKIKYGEDLADSLSIELARARNDSKAVSDRADKVSAENQALRNDIKQLSSTKVALEKSIARLTDDKASVEKKLVETENIIQGRIDEIWKIKKDVDTRFDMSKNNAGEVELAPIVVNAASSPMKTEPASARRSSGSVVSVNEENNFVVIDIGENDGIQNGDTFKVFRGKDQIGSVAVIQVRKDISAADIKQKTAAFKAGDQVR